MQARTKVVSALALTWGLAAQAAPLAPRLFPESLPPADAPETLAKQEPTVIQKTGDPEVIVVEREKERRGSETGLYALVGAGADGYRGGLAQHLHLGPAAGAFIGVKEHVLGLEGGYTVAGSDVKGVPEGVGPGPDVVRNSGQAALTVGLSDTPFQPFVMGGVGMDWYHVRNPAAGLQNERNLFVPVGVGARWNLTRFLTLDARGNYSFLFNPQVAPGTTSNSQRYGGLLSIGGTL